MNSLLLFFSTVIFAQDLPYVNVLNGEVQPGFYRAGLRYGKPQGDSIHIRWSHAAEADTFWVYKGSQSLQYITNANIRTVWYSQPLKYERRMATHHLKEHIFESPLKFEHLENLPKNRNPQFLGKGLRDHFSN